MAKKQGDVVNGWTDTETAAEEAGYNQAYLRELLKEGKVEGRKVARDWLVNRESLEDYKATTKRGRPRKK